MSNIILKLVYRDREPTQYDDETKDYLIGQPWFNILTQGYYICLSNEENNALWEKIKYNIAPNDYIRVGFSRFLGNDKSVNINTGLPQTIDHVTVTPVENTFGELGHVYVKQTNQYIEVRNTGTFDGQFCWFVAGKREKRYNLTIILINKGIVRDENNDIYCEDKCEFNLQEGTHIQLETINDETTAFHSWELDHEIDPTDFILQQDTVIVAYFEVIMLELTVQKSGNGRGLVKSDDNLITCGHQCLYTFIKNSIVELEAIPDDGFEFSEWNGVNSEDSNQATVIMDDHKTVEAIFGQYDYEFQTSEPPQYSLFIDTNFANGHVQSEDGNIYCGSTCIYDYNKYDNVIVEAIPDENHKFSHWEIDRSDIDAKINLIMDSNKTIRPVFIEKEHKVTVTIIGGGRITGDMDVYDVYEDYISHNSEISIDAIAFDSYNFKKWYVNENERADSDITIIIDEQKNIVCHFVSKKYEINIEVNGPGNVESRDGEILCPVVNCNHSYIHGSVVYLNAIVHAGEEFNKWIVNNQEFESLTLALLIDRDIDISAYFDVITYLLSLTITGNGSIISEDNDIDCSNECEYEFSHNTEITLEAQPDEGYVFNGWSGDIGDVDNEEEILQITMDRARNIVAEFIESVWELIVNIIGDGTVECNHNELECSNDTCNGHYTTDTVVELNAIPDTDKILRNWDGCHWRDIYNNCYVEMTEDTEIDVIFDVKPDPVPYGYVCGGQSGPVVFSMIHRFQFPLNNGVSEIGQLNIGRREACGSNASLHFYIYGGNSLPVNLSSIERFSFSADSGTATNTATLSREKRKPASTNCLNYGYVCAGETDEDTVNDIERFDFSIDNANANKVGNINQSKYLACAANSTRYSYICGGWISNGNIHSTIERFSFFLDFGDIIDEFKLNNEISESSSNNSSQHAYTYGGTYWTSGGSTNLYKTIERFEFPLNANAEIIGELDYKTRFTSSNNSSEHGFISGGTEEGSESENIRKIIFPANDGIVNVVANLSGTQTRSVATDGTDFTNLFV